MIRNLIFITITVLSCYHSVHAQTTNEWLRQRKTQRQYLIKQITLLNTYVGYIKKGCDIADKGLHAINNVKDGEFSLHRDFLGSLKTVNPNLAKSAKVSDIILFQLFIVKNLNAINKFALHAKGLTPEDVRYVTSVYLNMLRLCDASISELLELVFSDKLKMTDDQRLNCINKLHALSSDRVAFAKHFDCDVKTLAHARASEMNSLSTAYSQFGIR